MARSDISQPKLEFNIRKFLIPFMLLHGLVSVIVSCFQIVDIRQFKQSSVPITAIITDIIEYKKSNNEVSYRINVDYEVAGEKYSTILNRYSSSMRIGQDITVYVDTKNPSDVRGSTSIGVQLVFLFFSFLITFPIVFIMIKIEQRNKKLKREGYCVNCEISEVEVKRTHSQHGSHRSWKIVCHYTDPKTGTIYTYKSPAFRIRPSKYLEKHQIKTMPVYIDINNKEKHFMDVSNIL